MLRTDEADTLRRVGRSCSSLTGRQRNDECPACRRGKRSTDRGTLAPTAIGGPPDRRKKRIAFATRHIELAAGGLGSSEIVNSFADIRDPGRLPRQKGHRSCLIARRSREGQSDPRPRNRRSADARPGRRAKLSSRGGHARSVSAWRSSTARSSALAACAGSTSARRNRSIAGERACQPAPYRCGQATAQFKQRHHGHRDQPWPDLAGTAFRG